MSLIKETINLLGLKATDKVTGRAGVITSVGFDLYGCIQAVVTPPYSEDKEAKGGFWHDVNRLNIDHHSPRVMVVPDFNAKADTIAELQAGGADKPLMHV